MPRKSESLISARVVSWLASIPRTIVRKRRATSGLKGLPDITACCNGFHIELEGKSASGITSPKQQYYLRKYSECGAIAGIYYTLADAQRIVYEGLAAKGLILPKNLFSEHFDQQN